MTRPKVVVESLPPVRYDAIVWPRFERTRDALSKAIADIGSANMLASLSSARPPIAIADAKGNVLANVFERNRYDRVVHTVPAGSHECFSGDMTDVHLEAARDGIVDRLTMTCQRSHRPGPVPIDRLSDTAAVPHMLNMFAEILKAADTQHGVVVDEVPEELRHAVAGAALEHLASCDRKRMPPTLYGPNVMACATGRTTGSASNLTIRSETSNSGINMRHLPAVVRMIVDHDPFGEVRLSAHLTMQTIVCPIGDMDAIDRMRMLAAWHEHLERLGNPKP